MALNDVSLNLRDNEFVAILGPSGSGKTTLLNIIGGLDRYDSGDLIINGVTTKKYKDRDWDSYRNHTVGFVFQSYNLIPHQSVLANVELALTIGGISRAERRRRAEEALAKVGLQEHMYKKPNQMSGGQMQRVAIARALVNDPHILLADEPTGALDSETSVQVMELLKEVANDRLVVMVTHNPELADQYANRIVTLKDGRITSDSNPFDVNEADEGIPVHRNLGKSSMSFLTALALSFNNLWTKKARTILVAFAGSIGIIGIALILSLSNGVNKYIADTEEETLAEYPLEVQKTSFDLSSFIVQETEDTFEEKEESGFDVIETRIVNNLFSTMDSNDLVNLKKHLEASDSRVMDYAQAVEYHYGVTPWIFIRENEKEKEKENEYRQVCPSSMNSAFSGEMQFYSMMGANTELFAELPTEDKLYRDEYEVLKGRWPENGHEAILVLMHRSYITDLMLYSLGLRDGKELDDMIKKFSEGEVVEVKEGDPLSFNYDDFIGISYKVVPSYRKYSYDKKYKVWTDKSDDKKYMNELVSDGIDLTIVGVAAPREGTRVAMLSPGIRYISDLTQEIVDEASMSNVVKDQLKNRKRNVFTGKDFSDESDDINFDMESLFSVDEQAFANAININTDAFDMSAFDMSGLDMSAFDMSSLDMSAFDMSSIDMSQFDMSAFDPNSFDMSQLDMSQLDMSQLDMSQFDMSAFDPEAFNMDSFGMDGFNMDSLDLSNLDLSSLDLSSIDMGQIDLPPIDTSDINLGEIDMESIIASMNLDDIDLSSAINPEDLMISLPALSRDDLKSLLDGVEIDATEEEIVGLVSKILKEFSEKYREEIESMIKSIADSFSKYLESESFKTLMDQEIQEIRNGVKLPEFNQKDLADMVDRIMAGFSDFASSYDPAGDKSLEEYYREYMESGEIQNILAQEVANINGLVDEIELPEIDPRAISDRITADYNQYAKDNDVPGAADVLKAFEDFVNTESGSAFIEESIKEIIDTEAIEKQLQENANRLIQNYMAPVGQQLSESLGGVMNELMQNAMGSAMQGIIAGYGNAMEQTMNTYSEAIETAINQAMVEYGSQVTKAITDQVSTALSGATSEMESAVSQMQDTIAKMMDVFAKMQNTIIGMGQGFTQMQDTISKMIEAFSKMQEATSGIGDSFTEMQKAISGMGDAFSGMGNAFAGMGDTLAKMQDAMAGFGNAFNGFEDVISIDENALANAFSFNMTEKELEELMSSLMTKGYASYEGNLQKMGYADFNDPMGISIYPQNFESKDGIVAILEEYNQMMEDSGQGEKVVRYTDIVGTLMTSVTDIVNSISNVLIAFVGISLVVSSIMIGVITYISVLERRKEIGILRAIGASKSNISGVFNAETFIIGLLAGLFGVGIARLLVFPTNYIIHTFSNAKTLYAYLPLKAAVLLVLLSIVLTLIGGLIPSRKAAKSDPVTALRTE